MVDYIKTIFDFTKLPTKFFVLFLAVSGFILFANDYLINLFNLATVRDKYGEYFGFVFIFSTCLVIINFIIWLSNYITRKKRTKKALETYINKLKVLDINEQAVLREFAIQSQSSIEVPYDNPVISGLLEKNILVINKQFGNSFIMNFNKVSVSINDYALQHLKMEYIGLVDNPSEEVKEEVWRKRPNWTKNNNWR